MIQTVIDYAIEEISQCNPKILDWNIWSKQKTNTKEFLGKFLQYDSFFSDAHSLLDHRDYHLKTISRELDFIVHKVVEWFWNFKDREWDDRYYDLTKFSKKTIAKYNKFFIEFKKLADSGELDIPKDNKFAQKYYWKYINKW